MGLDKEIKEINIDLDTLSTLNTTLSTIQTQNAQIIALLTSLHEGVIGELPE